MSKTTPFAVLTGDIVQSRRLSPDVLDDVRAGVMEALQLAKSWRRGVVRGTPEFFRGDAWQALVGHPERALRIAVLIRAWLKAEGLADTRIAVAVGPVERVSTRRVSLSTGLAFFRSGEALDTMPAATRLTVVGSTDASALGPWLPVVGGLVDAHVREWTARQAEIVMHAIDPAEPTHEAIADALSVSQQAVTRALGGANWGAVRAAIRQFEATDWVRDG